MGWVSADVPGCGLFDTGVLLLLLFTAAAAEATLAARCGECGAVATMAITYF